MLRRHDSHLDAFFKAMAAVSVSARYKQHALFDVCAALTTQHIAFTQLTPEAFLHYAHQTRVGGLGRTDNTTYVGHTAWRVLSETGQFPSSTPLTLRAATRVPQLTPTELVDRFQPGNAPDARTNTRASAVQCCASTRRWPAGSASSKQTFSHDDHPLKPRAGSVRSKASTSP